MADFFAARGLELMNAQRYKDAAACFEIAFRNQPNNVVVIDKLINCYEFLENDAQADAYQRRLERVLSNIKKNGWHHELN